MGHTGHILITDKVIVRHSYGEFAAKFLKPKIDSYISISLIFQELNLNLKNDLCLKKFFKVDTLPENLQVGHSNISGESNFDLRIGGLPFLKLKNMNCKNTL